MIEWKSDRCLTWKEVDRRRDGEITEEMLEDMEKIGR